MMSEAFPDHFSSVAARYADFRPQYPDTLFDYLATLLPAKATVWDCAAGNGQATRGLASRFANVIATDASAEQIASAPALPNAVFRTALAENSGLEAHSVDLVTVAQALHWFKLDAFYLEVGRVLKPGGLLAVWCYGILQVEDESIDAAAQRYYGETLGPYWPPTRFMVEEGYGNLPFPYPEITPPSLFMEVRWTRNQLLGYFSTWSAARQFQKAKGDDPLPAFAETLATLWPHTEQTQRIRFPITMRAGRKPA